MTSKEFKDLMDSICNEYNWKFDAIKEEENDILYTSESLDVEYWLKKNNTLIILIASIYSFNTDATMVYEEDYATSKSAESSIKATIIDYIRMSIEYEEWVRQCDDSLEKKKKILLTQLSNDYSNELCFLSVNKLQEIAFNK